MEGLQYQINKKKYPTKEEVVAQYELIVSQVKGVKDMCGIQRLLDSGLFTKEDININFLDFEDYERQIEEGINKDIEVFRYEYKNIILYAEIYNNSKVKIDKYVFIYDNEGNEIDSCKYIEWEGIVE